MTEDNLNELLKPPSQEKLSDAGKIGVLLLKIMSSDWIGVYEILADYPSQKRLDEWCKQVSEQLVQLHEKVKVLELNTPSFESTCIHTTQLALRTHVQEKRQLLCNAVLNSAVPSTLPEEMHRQIYMELLSKLTPTHIKVLRLFASQKLAHVHIELGDPSWINVINFVEPMHEVFDQNVPETIGYEDLRFRFVNDLFAEGLIANILPEREMLSEIAHSPKPTPLAKGFLKFIESPLEN